MTDDRVTPLTLLASRVVIGAVFLLHGVPKAFDIEAATRKFVGFGLPGFLGPITGWVEIVAATLLILGVLHRAAALALLVVIAGALVTVQIPGGISAGLERDLVILTGLSVLALLGPGRFALRPQPSTD